MPGPTKKKPIERIIDANVNRAREGLRVCEEITRFITEDRGLTTDLKNTRHAITALIKKLPGYQDLLWQRESRTDIGRDIYANELKRKDFKEVFWANIQRAKESLRVLEEFSKLKQQKIAVAFKKLRYQTYESEKKFAQALKSLRRN